MRKKSEDNIIGPSRLRSLDLDNFFCYTRWNYVYNWKRSYNIIIFLSIKDMSRLQSSGAPYLSARGAVISGTAVIRDSAWMLAGIVVCGFHYCV